jgi:hypothetical protein
LSFSSFLKINLTLALFSTLSASPISDKLASSLTLFSNKSKSQIESSSFDLAINLANSSFKGELNDYFNVN